MNKLVEEIFSSPNSETEKLFLLYIVFNDNTKVELKQLIGKLCSSVPKFNQVTAELQNKSIISVSADVFYYNLQNRLYQLTVEGFKLKSKTLVRKPSTLVDVARDKLNELRTTSFVGKSAAIYQLSLNYDKLYNEYTGKSRTSLPPVWQHAKNTKTYTAFERTLQLIKDRQFNSLVYLKAQFEAMKKHSKKFGLLYPYINMLYSQWAIDNYVWYVKSGVERGLTSNILTSEVDTLKNVIISSHNIFKNFQEANLELSKLQCLLMLQDNLSPVYLCCSKTFLHHITETDQELSSDIKTVLDRMGNNKEYRVKIKTVYKGIVDDKPNI